jgi:fatty-acyl-CoA synthase
MAALVAGGTLDFAELRAHLMRHLPAYARPLFLRIQDGIAVTDTFKHLKADLIREGFNPAAREPIYFNDPSQQAYIPLDAKLFGRIQDGTIRL